MTAVVAIGSNLGDRRAAICFAVEQLTPLIGNLTLSDVIETEPEGEGTQDQSPYLNAVVVGQTSLGARELLDGLLGPLQPPTKPVVISSNVTVNGGHVQIGHGNTQNITYRAVLAEALTAVEESEDVPAAVASALRKLHDFPDIDRLLGEAAKRAAKGR